MTLTKDHLIDAISKENGFQKKQSLEIIETLLEIIKSKLESGLSHVSGTPTLACHRWGSWLLGTSASSTPVTSNSWLLTGRSWLTTGASPSSTGG